MKKWIRCLSSAFLSMLFCMGCGSPASKSLSTPVSAISSFPVFSEMLSSLSTTNSSSIPQPVSVYSSQWSSHVAVPVEDDPGYFIFVDGMLVGSYHDDQWHNINDRDISVADLLNQEAYYCYGQSSLIGVSNKLTFYYYFDFGCSFEDDPQPLFPFADENDTKDEDFTFILPCTLPQDLHYIRYETYNQNIGFNIKSPSSSIPLILSTDFNPLPKTEVKKLTKYSKGDKSAIAAEMVNMGIAGTQVNITECYDYDYDSDGVIERFIFANAPEDKDGFQQSPYYYMVLCKDGDGYKTVTSWCYKDYGDTAMQSVNLIGLFDLNNDGIYELCLDNPEWEHEKVYVFSLNAQNVWECVLTGSGGM